MTVYPPVFAKCQVCNVTDAARARNPGDARADSLEVRNSILSNLSIAKASIAFLGLRPKKAGMLKMQPTINTMKYNGFLSIFIIFFAIFAMAKPQFYFEKWRKWQKMMAKINT